MKFTKKHKEHKKSKQLHPTTMMVNNVQREKSRKAVRDVLSWLSSNFPKAFNVEGAIRPLKIGILEDILAYAEQQGGLPFSKTKLKMGLIVFTRRMEYLTCVKMRDTRIDLQGNEVEAVSEEGAKLAIQRIKKTIEKTMRPQRKTTSTRSNYGEKPYRSTGQQKRRYSSPHYGNYNPYHESSPRDPQQGSYFHDNEDQPSTTIKVKKRYSPKNRDAEAHSSSVSHHGQEKNYNSEIYNTSSLSTVERLKAKLGISRRKETFNYED